MNTHTTAAFITGYERIGAWSDVLDRINVFPVADGDTGRNLMISLAPLRALNNQNPQKTIQELLFSGRGNSGNIAIQFITEMLKAGSFESLHAAAKAGGKSAWKAVNNPKAGTMLSVLDQFAEAIEHLRDQEDLENHLDAVVDRIQGAVHETTELLPELKAAGVVDAGALGMFLFLEGFLRGLCNRKENFRAIQDVFVNRLTISETLDKSSEDGFCVDFVVRMGADSSRSLRNLTESNESVMVHMFEDYAKIHLHTSDVRTLKEKAQSMGAIVQWSQDDLSEQVRNFYLPAMQTQVHIVTDAAGSLTREFAQRLGISLLESYVTLGETCTPETSVIPEELYKAMRNRIKASTSQASVFERHQHYDRLLKQYEKVLYLCVGSVYTGNYQVAMEWKEQNDPDDRLTVIDSGAASGRLAAAVITTAQYAAGNPQPMPNQIIEFARNAVEKSGEYIFLDELKYLAAGGRMSKTGAFFGDLLNMKPVVTPTATGAEKVGIVRNADAQVRFAMDKLLKNLEDQSEALILLEYSDNRQWIEERVMVEIKASFKSCKILVQPLSLTSGVHIGPGAWAVAYYGNPPGQPGSKATKH